MLVHMCICMFGSVFHNTFSPLASVTDNYHIDHTGSKILPLKTSDLENSCTLLQLLSLIGFTRICAMRLSSNPVKSYMAVCPISKV